MLNQFIVVGRIVDFTYLGDVCVVDIKVKSTQKNDNSEYEEDEISIYINSKIVSRVIELFKKGTVIGVKGKIKNSSGKMRLFADKVTFITNNMKDVN